MSGFSDLSTRDKRALVVLGVAVAVTGAWFLLFTGSSTTVVGMNSVPLAEGQLNRLRQIDAALPAKEAALKQVETELAAREKAILTSETAAIAQARLLEVVRRVGSSNGIEIRGGEFGQTPKVFGDAFGEVFAGVTFTCGIDQFVNFFAALSHETDLIEPYELTMNAQDQKNKTLSVRMSLSGVVPKKLIPEKKGYGL